MPTKYSTVSEHTVYALCILLNIILAKLRLFSLSGATAVLLVSLRPCNAFLPTLKREGPLDYLDSKLSSLCGCNAYSNSEVCVGEQMT